MDARRFDGLAKSLAQSTSRRSILRAVLGAAAASLARPRRGSAQATTRPVPNLPFLVPLPTDARFADYGLDFDLTGPPTRFRTVDGLTAMPASWRAILQADFRAAYGATITVPQSETNNKPRRSISTLVVDLGTRRAAENVHAGYVAAVLDDPALSPEASDLATNRFVFAGCQGRCRRLSSVLPSSTEPNQEFAVVGRRDRFLFDARVRDYTDGPVTIAEIEAVSRVVDAKLRTAASATSIGSTLRTVAGAVFAAASTGAAAPGASVPAQRVTTDELMESLLAANTLPLFGVGADPVPDTATHWLIVDGGEAVRDYGQSSAEEKRTQRVLEDVEFALRLEQSPLTTSPYLGGYDLRLRAGQFVFLNAKRAGEFLGATRNRLEQGDRDRDLATIAEGETEQRFGSEAASANGTAFGLIVALLVPGGLIDAVVEVELTAVPQAPGQFPIDLGTLQRDLGPLLGEIARVLADCLTAPDACPESSVLPVPGPLPLPEPPTPEPPTPLPAEPACPAGTTLCNGACADLATDYTNCGLCGFFCSEGFVCSGGTCACPPGLIDCGGCVDPAAHPTNCGGCGITCLPDQICATGACLCPDGYPACGDVCCVAGQACDGGICYDIDPCGGLTNCGDYCADLSNDPANCGACGTACKSQACCAFTCTDVAFDPANCGGCGIACNQGDTCYFGSCQPG